jgi:hypothetical protein
MRAGSSTGSRNVQNAAALFVAFFQFERQRQVIGEP